MSTLLVVTLALIGVALLSNYCVIFWRFLPKYNTPTLSVAAVEVFHNDTSSKPVITSSMKDPNNNNWCQSSLDYLKGTWVYDDNNNSTDLAYAYLTDQEEWAPRCNELQTAYLQSGNQSQLVPQFLRYKWQPNSCNLDHVWDREKFCRTLDGKTIGISGDSMSLQLANSIMGLSLGTVEQEQFITKRPLVEGEEGSWQLRVPLCPQQFQQQQKYSVNLVFHRWNAYKGREQDRQALGELLQESDYLILNWGLHPTTPTNPLATAMDDLAEFLHANWKPPQKKPERLFWRSTVVAHGKCSKYDAPIKLKKYDYHYMKLMGFIHKAYDGHIILKHDDQIVKPKLLAKLPNMTILRVEQMTMSRIDGHRVQGRNGVEDCLHYCEPGPVDSWAQLFYHHVVTLNM
ncbi:Protein trichome birefringence-like [Seminavis robusta]|uniref:Protein trichome birefringence-like n=1 Tax=Seminavis robusta TaxID=568900 RepID=A0A9N8DV37_9STRA|nr:Protein trichome birefringence-like [Seminavis robusta]|eukprot:Sro298_g111220.1 Protein trichome birefringence-like (401) ;mRNA; r:67000-68202